MKLWNKLRLSGAAMPRALFIISLFLLFALTACQTIGPILEPAPAAEETQSPGDTQPAPQFSVTPAGTSEASITPAPAGPVTLRLWLPPEFDPDAGTPSGDLLSARLEAFTTENPDVHIEVRIKALEGTGGLLESLAAANAAAPLALPDLVALPRPLLDSAALKGLLHPYDGLTTVMEKDTWYDYARQLAYLQESIFGLPFAGDALLMPYRPDVIDLPPRDWESALSLGQALAFSALDPQALFTLQQYQTAGGVIMDAQGRPYLDEAILTEVLEFYAQGSQSGLMPLWVTQLETDDQVWQAFAEGQSPLAILWAAHYFSEASNLPFEADFTPLLTADGQVSTLAAGWVWALASPDPSRQALAAQLAEYLVEPEFLAAWDYAAGYLPPSTDALAGWGDETQRSLIGRISLTAGLIPSEDLLSSLGPALQEAALLVLKQQASPQTAAEIAVEKVNQP
jgi:ABC-type glycerol-3-phosphate transport system substrate-binding protein